MLPEKGRGNCCLYNHQTLTKHMYSTLSFRVTRKTTEQWSLIASCFMKTKIAKVTLLQPSVKNPTQTRTLDLKKDRLPKNGPVGKTGTQRLKYY